MGHPSFSYTSLIETNHRQMYLKYSVKTYTNDFSFLSFFFLASTNEVLLETNCGCSLQILYGCVHATPAKLSRHKRGCTIYKIECIYCLVLYRKSLLTPVLYHHGKFTSPWLYLNFPSHGNSFFLTAWSRYNWQGNCTYFKHIMQRLHRCIPSEMVTTTVQLLDTSIISHSYIFHGSDNT